MEAGEGSETEGRKGRRLGIIEALEHYTAKHGGDSLEDILNWPWKRFHSFYEAMIRREIADELTQKKITIIGSLWTKDFEEEEGLHKAVKGIEDAYENVISEVMGGGNFEEEKEEDIDYENNPFMAAGKRALEQNAIPDDYGFEDNKPTKEMVEIDEELKKLDQA